MRELVPVRPEIINCPAADSGNSSGRGTVLDALASQVPDVIDTIRRIAEQTAATSNAVKIIEAQCLQITTETMDFVQREACRRQTIRDQGDIVLQAMREVHKQLADLNIPEAARILVAQQIPIWIAAILEATNCKGG